MNSASADGAGEGLRVRLSSDARREQLLAAGVELLKARPYREVFIDDIAEAAGVSKGLLCERPGVVATEGSLDRRQGAVSGAPPGAASGMEEAAR